MYKLLYLGTEWYELSWKVKVNIEKKKSRVCVAINSTVLIDCVVSFREQFVLTASLDRTKHLFVERRL